MDKRLVQFFTGNRSWTSIQLTLPPEIHAETPIRFLNVFMILLLWKLYDDLQRELQVIIKTVDVILKPL